MTDIDLTTPWHRLGAKSREARRELAYDFLCAVAETYGFTPKQIQGRSRDLSLVYCRSVFVTGCRDTLGMSWPEISRIYLPNRKTGHTSAIGAYRRADADTRVAANLIFKGMTR
jgi:chromosomal replication initiation ATPase DnaA